MSVREREREGGGGGGELAKPSENYMYALPDKLINIQFGH